MINELGIVAFKMDHKLIYQLRAGFYGFEEIAFYFPAPPMQFFKNIFGVL